MKKVFLFFIIFSMLLNVATLAEINLNSTASVANPPYTGSEKVDSDSIFIVNACSLYYIIDDSNKSVENNKSLVAFFKKSVNNENLNPVYRKFAAILTETYLFEPEKLTEKLSKGTFKDFFKEYEKNLQDVIALEPDFQAPYVYLGLIQVGYYFESKDNNYKLSAIDNFIKALDLQKKQSYDRIVMTSICLLYELLDESDISLKFINTQEAKEKTLEAAEKVKKEVVLDFQFNDKKYDYKFIILDKTKKEIEAYIASHYIKQ